jgi:hypothetical protein
VDDAGFIVTVLPRAGRGPVIEDKDISKGRVDALSGCVAAEPLALAVAARARARARTAISAPRALKPRAGHSCCCTPPPACSLPHPLRSFVRYQVAYKALMFRPFKNEVLDAVVKSVSEVGFFAEAGPLSILVSHAHIPDDMEFVP